MVQRLTSIGAVVLRLMVVLAMLACPRVGAAQGATGTPVPAGTIPGPGPGATISGYAAGNPQGGSIVSAPAGTAIAILGTNLGNGGAVAFNGIPAPPPTTWYPDRIVVTVPAAPSYPFTGPVTVTTHGQTAKGPD